jgi:hypothetical protein
MLTTEQKTEKLKAVFAHRKHLLAEPHMRSLPIIGHCSIEMVGGPDMEECLGDLHYALLARSLNWLQGVDGELTMRMHLMEILGALSTFDLGDLEEACMRILRAPSAPPKPYRKKRYDPSTRLLDYSPMTYTQAVHSARGDELDLPF